MMDSNVGKHKYSSLYKQRCWMMTLLFLVKEKCRRGIEEKYWGVKGNSKDFEERLADRDPRNGLARLLEVG